MNYLYMKLCKITKMHKPKETKTISLKLSALLSGLVTTNGEPTKSLFDLLYEKTYYIRNWDKYLIHGQRLNINITSP